jgi:hypothetical protein
MITSIFSKIVFRWHDIYAQHSGKGEGEVHIEDASP